MDDWIELGEGSYVRLAAIAAFHPRCTTEEAERLAVVPVDGAEYVRAVIVLRDGTTIPSYRTCIELRNRIKKATQ